MKRFITARPEAGLSGFGSPYDPVLAGVAQGLARLFPPLESARPTPGRTAKAGDGPSVAARTGDTAAGGARG